MMPNNPESGCERNHEPGEICQMQSGGSGAIQCRVRIRPRRFPRMATRQLSNCDLVRARLTSSMEMREAAPRDGLQSCHLPIQALVSTLPCSIAIRT